MRRPVDVLVFSDSKDKRKEMRHNAPVTGLRPITFLSSLMTVILNQVPVVMELGSSDRSAIFSLYSSYNRAKRVIFGTSPTR